jgi:deazaflavin-dependent oxidoreductase (nitroreductase family)
MERKLIRQLMKYANRFFMVPVLRVGLGWMMGSPLSGYIMLLRTTGRKSGLKRYTPLNYAIVDGEVVCMAGFGDGTHWLANIEADPHVEVRLPGRTFRGTASLVNDNSTAKRLAVKVARNAGFALAFEGLDLFGASDDELARRLDDRPVVHIHPDGERVTPGPFDPGGKGWVISWLGQIALAVGLFNALRRKSRTPAMRVGG